MKYIYAVETPEELMEYQSFVDSAVPKLEDYFIYLRKEYEVNTLPNAIVLASEETATKLISDIPLPGYTNAFRTVFCPDLEVWRKIYLRQIKNSDNTAVHDYYMTKLNQNHILQILGHEFVHHSHLFLDGFDCDYERGIWFEEGMCEYISRKYFLTEEEFREEARINALLVEQFRESYGTHPLEEFGLSTYQNDYASIFFEYWRSFLAVNKIIEDHGGDIHAVFRSYRQWNTQNSPLTLEQWFQIF